MSNSLGIDSRVRTTFARTVSEVWEDDSDPDDGQFSSAADQQLDGWVRNF